VLLGANGGLDDEGMVGVRDQGDDEVDLLKFPVEGGGVVDVERDGRGVGEALAELLGALERSAGYIMPLSACMISFFPPPPFIFLPAAVTAAVHWTSTPAEQTQ